MGGDYFLGDRKFRLDEVPISEAGEHDALIRIAARGICGMDARIYHGNKGSAEVHPPVTLGREPAGVVGETDNTAITVKPGDHVIVDPSSYCGKCHYCKIGKRQACENLYAVGVNRDGGFAQYCAVSETQCYQLDKEVPLRYGAMTEPLACCIHGINQIGLVPGSIICAVGGGAIGPIMVQLAKLSDVSKVALSKSVSMRCEIGMKVGMDTVTDPVYEEIGQRLAEILGTPGTDVVIKCVGVPAAAGQASKAADKGAVILLFSVPSPGSIYAMHLEEIFQEELTIVGSIINPDTHGRAIALISSNAIQLEPLIVYLLPLNQLEQAIPAQQSSGSTRAIVEP